LLLQPSFMRSDALQAHARLFFPDADLSTEPAATAEALLGELDGADSSLQDYVAYVLLDFAAADSTLGEVAVAQALSIAEALGVRARFEEKAGKELRINRKRLATLRDDAPALLARAAGAAP
jgi:hypothetical protein